MNQGQVETSINVQYVAEILATVPDAPGIVLATAGSAEATANWTPPTSDGGSPVTLYHVRIVDAATGKTAPALKDVAATATSLSFAGLPGGVPVIPATRPGAPKISTAVAGVGSALGRWTAPASSGSAVTSYRVRVVDGATGKTPLILGDIAGNLTSLNVTGLAKGTSVRFQVQAINALGTSEVSAQSNAVTVLAAAPKTRTVSTPTLRASEHSGPARFAAITRSSSPNAPTTAPMAAS